MAFLLPLEGEPALIATPGWDRARLAERADFDIVAVEPEAFLASVRSALDRRGLEAGDGRSPAARSLARCSEAWPSVIDGPVAPGDEMVSDLARTSRRVVARLRA